MTDAHLPGRWLIDPKMENLSDRAWRTFTGMLMYSNEQGTDGLIGQRAVRLLHPEGVTSQVLTELVDAELIEPRGANFAVLNWSKSQSTAEYVEHQRQKSRDSSAKSRQREREKAQAALAASQQPPESPQATQQSSGQSVTGHGPGHVPAHVGQARTGEDRTGQDSSGAPRSIARGGITNEQREEIAASWSNPQNRRTA